MLEGTKNEKAVLVLLAYIIGLVSGFIGFGISGSYKTEVAYSDFSNTVSTQYLPLPSEAPSYDITGYTPPTSNPPTNDESASVPVQYEDGQLTVLTSEGALVLSVHVDQFDGAVPEPLLAQGHHVVPPVYIPSPNGRYLYFCEQHLGDNGCINLLFDKEAVTIQYIQVENKKLNTSISQAASAYWSTQGLHINDYISESQAAPWKLNKKSQ